MEVLAPVRRAGLLALAIVFAAPQPAQAEPRSPASPSVEAIVVGSDSFLAAHPDIRYRLLGLKAYEAGRFAKALEHFKRAARYADKPSQGMVAELLWSGQGTAQDRPLAHAWMELAAERGFKVMLAQRDRYWAALSEPERARARRLHADVRADYADAVAQPRLERVLRRARAATTGSRTGATGSVQIILPGPGGDVRLDGSQFYQDKFWEPAKYWAWQAQEWKDPPKGRVEVGPLQVPATP